LNSNKYLIFTNGQGLEVLDELIQQFHAKFIFDKDNQYQTSFNLGQKDVIDYILARIQDVDK
jgi:hypothetical protein